jgi:chromosome segregation ATPase
MSKDLTEKLNGSIEDKLDRLIAAVQSMDSRLGNVETRLERVETRLVTVETRLETVETRLESLEVKVDERMKETRPMWEALKAQLTELSESQEKGFRRFDRAMDLVVGDLTRLHGDHVEVESRVVKIEKHLNQ